MKDGIDPREPWMQTHTGKHVALLNPTPDMIDLRDIDYALQRLVRFTGHGRWSVAHHSLIVGMIVQEAGHDEQTVRTAYLHDATEAYIGDLSRPLKQALRIMSPNVTSDLDVIEAALWGAIAERFDLHHRMPDVVKWADNVALGFEANDLFGHGTRERWALPDGRMPAVIHESLIAAVGTRWLT